MMTSDKNARAKIVALVKANRTELEANLATMWLRFAEDFVTAGLDRSAVIATMGDVAIALSVSEHGAPATVEALRATADLHEQRHEKLGEVPTAH